MTERFRPWTALDRFWEEFARAGWEAFEAGGGREAGAFWRTASELARGFADDDPRRAAALSNLAAAHRLEGDRAGALARTRDALAIWGRAGAWIERMEIRLPARSSSYHLRLETRHRGDLERLQRHLKARLASGGEAASLNNLALLLGADGREGEAARLFETALERRAAAIGPRDPGLARICANAAACLAALGRAEEAAGLRARAARACADPSTPGPERLEREAGPGMTDDRRLTAAAYLTATLGGVAG